MLLTISIIGYILFLSVVLAFFKGATRYDQEENQ
jgi:hypothetical protein